MTKTVTLAEQLAKLDERPLQKAVDAATGASAPRRGVKFSFDTDELAKSEEVEVPLTKSAINTTQDLKRGGQITRLAFEEDPTAINYYQSLWKPKAYLLPDYVLKQIGYRDSLVATILGARSNQIAAFGRELQDRFATGFRIEPRRGVMEDASDEQKEELQRRISNASKALGTCGSIEGVDPDDRQPLSIFLGLQARNGLLLGRFATEIIYTRESDGTRRFHSFRAVDAGTIYRAAPRHDSVESVRRQALHLLEQIRGPDAEKLRPEKFENEEYAWVQVIEGKPRQAFTPEEMIVHNLYPVTDIEMRGYPITPIDNAIDAVITHMNITQHNKLFFQSGRAARGMIVIKSTDVDQGLVSQIRQHFNASINSVQNAWRVPVFGVDPEDSVEWAPFDGGAGRDMEFQYLSDSNAREICAAFHISPEEVPGYQHLSRGTNNQALSESNNEYKLLAARDVGIRPLLNQFQDFLNDRVLPLIDPMVAQLCTLKLYGLDADTAEKESTRIQQDMAVHMTIDEILERTEKDPIGKEWGGRFLLNPAWQSVLDKYFTVGEIAEFFFERKGAAKDPGLAYIRDPFWFQWQQLQMQMQQMQMQQQQMEMQAQAQQQGQGEPGEEDQDGGSGEEPESELAAGADQVLEMISKSEAQLPSAKRRLLHRHNAIVKNAMDQWERDSKTALAEIVAVAKQHQE
ncbi:portal protein [Myxococcus phage Mx1]|nr:portal protein [Myxococcus phage Mx1]